jgi:hypothetical protein
LLIALLEVTLAKSFARVTDGPAASVSTLKIDIVLRNAGIVR